MNYNFNNMNVITQYTIIITSSIGEGSAPAFSSILIIATSPEDDAQ